MSQYDIIEVLKDRRKEWFTTKDLAELTGKTRFSITGVCKRLRNCDQVAFRVVQKPSSNNEYTYRYKPGTWYFGKG